MNRSVDLSLIGKRLHWAVVGHAFRPVHEHLDELVASWRDLADVIAERDAISQDVLIDVVRTLEHQPPRRPTIARPARESRAG